jgi:hypothetical protein
MEVIIKLDYLYPSNTKASHKIRALPQVRISQLFFNNCLTAKLLLWMVVSIVIRTLAFGYYEKLEMPKSAVRSRLNTLPFEYR